MRMGGSVPHPARSGPTPHPRRSARRSVSVNWRRSSSRRSFRIPRARQPAKNQAARAGVGRAL